MTRQRRSLRTRATKGLRTTSQDGSGSPKLTDPREEPPGRTGDPPLRTAFTFELEQLRIQTEMMALRVDAALESSAKVLLGGDLELADKVVRGDDEIDAMFVSLTERCYELLVRQSPVAGDLRLIVSILRILSDLERTGDLCLRIVKLAPDHHLLARTPTTFQILTDMAHEGVELFRTAVRSFSAGDLRLAHTLEKRDDAMDAYNRLLMTEIMKLSGPSAVPQAVATVLAGRALERIADHSVMIGERLSYMLTGDVESISKEIGP